MGTSVEEMFNDDRGCSVYFGKELTNKFLLKNKLVTIIRAHEVFQEGYQQCFWRDQGKNPSVITIFSAPNYCGTMRNLGAYLRVEVIIIIFRTKRLKFHSLKKILSVIKETVSIFFPSRYLKSTIQLENCLKV